MAIDQDELDNHALGAAAKRQIAQETFRRLKASVKEHAHVAANQRAAELIRKVKEEIETADIFDVPKRDIKAMHTFGYEIINRELSRLNRNSLVRGLSDDEIQSLMRLMGTLNVTEKTKKSINEESDETKQKEGESDDDYRTRLESAIKR